MAAAGRYFPREKKRQIILILLLGIFSLGPEGAFAGRPLATDDAWTVDQGHFQIEAGFDAARRDNRDRELKPSLTLSYGLLDRMDLGIGYGYIFLTPKEGESENGVTDAEMKVKVRLVDEQDFLPAWTLAGKLKIPTASKSRGLGSGEADLGLNAVATKNLGKRWVLHLNLGYTFIGEDGATGEMNYSLAAQFILSKKWSLVGEAGGINNLNGRTGDDPFSGFLGATYLIRKYLVWDAGLEIGANSAAPEVRFTTGLTFLFNF